MAKRANEIIAFHLGWDIAEVSDARYQRYTNPTVYVVGDDYYCAPTTKQKLPTDVSDSPWEKVGTHYGRDVYRAKAS